MEVDFQSFYEEYPASDQDSQDFDQVYLPQCESLPESVYEHLKDQWLRNPYFMQLFDSKLKESLKDHYWCQNKQCNNGCTELFYPSIRDERCPECNTKVRGAVLKQMKDSMTRYQQTIDDIHRPTNEAIRASLRKVGISDDVSNLIYQYINEMAFVSYHKMQFQGSEFREPDKDIAHCMSYIDDKRAIQIALKKMKNQLKFGDVVEVGAYGLHFVGLDENGEFKLITNPCYEGYDSLHNAYHALACVPLEITEHEMMSDFMMFYRLNFINLFPATGARKIHKFPVSMAVVSFQKLKTLKDRLSLWDDFFMLPPDTVFYLESSNFSYIDNVLIEVEEMNGEKNCISFCIDPSSPLYPRSREHLKLVQKFICSLRLRMEEENGMASKRRYNGNKDESPPHKKQKTSDLLG